jgi:hypothetical protein
MRFRFFLFGFLFVFAILFISGCVKPKINVEEPLAVDFSKHQSIMVYVSTMVQDSSEEVKTLEEKIVKQIEKKTDFQRVVPYSLAPDSTTDLRLNAKILDLKKAGVGSALLGALVSHFLAKQAGIEVDIVIYDMKSGANMGEFDVSYYKNGETTNSVINVLAFRIAKILKKGY